jgi:hypothetical protein
MFRIKKPIFEAKRYIRIKPKYELLLVSFAFLSLFFMIFLAETEPGRTAEYYEMQSGFLIVSLIILIYRLSTSYDWIEHYKETINWLVGATLIDAYVAVSLLNVLLDIFVLLCLFFGVDADHVSFLRVSVVGIVYILLFAFSALKRFIATKLEERKKRNSS